MKLLFSNIPLKLDGFPAVVGFRGDFFNSPVSVIYLFLINKKQLNAPLAKQLKKNDYI